MAEISSKRRLRCAIYTRKSSEEGLEQDFNSLDAQREACNAYIASQKHEGWIGLSTRYDDGAYSGGTMERPALQTLLADIKARKIDVVVVYKVDRLTRALADFAKIVEVFDGHGVSFVSVTQAFNTTTSMGRLTLNVLLSFAQFEREVTGERIRDKIAASKQKGMWMGGFVPFGYRSHARTLVIEEPEAEIVRLIFALYLDHGTVRQVEAELKHRAIPIPGRTTIAGRLYGNRSFSRGQLYKLLSNPIYCGEISHKGTRHPGQHPPIISPETFTLVAKRLAANGHERKTGRNAKIPSLLAGLLIDADGNKLIAAHAVKKGQRYRYYISKALHVGRKPGRPSRDLLLGVGASASSLWRLPAAGIETIVVREIRSFLSDPMRLIDVVKGVAPDRSLAMAERTKLAEVAAKAADHLAGTDAGSARTQVLELVSAIEVRSDGVTIILNPSGLLATLGQEAAVHALTETEEPRLHIPMTLRRRGVETKMVLTGDGLPEAEPDETLIRAIARAHRWMNDLVEGNHGSIVDLAAAYATSANYVAKHLQLACLSPTLTQSILDGRQPVELTTWDLLNRIEIPLDWTDQARRLSSR